MISHFRLVPNDFFPVPSHFWLVLSHFRQVLNDFFQVLNDFWPVLSRFPLVLSDFRLGGSDFWRVPPDDAGRHINESPTTSVKAQLKCSASAEAYFEEASGHPENIHSISFIIRGGVVGNGSTDLGGFRANDK
ncbi:hypothetical protein BH23BAC4_BH23BAC4_03200 [soil metagenome]